MKKFLIVLLALMLAFSFIACTDDDDDKAPVEEPLVVTKDMLIGNWETLSDSDYEYTMLENYPNLDTGYDDSYSIRSASGYNKFTITEREIKYNTSIRFPGNIIEVIKNSIPYTDYPDWEIEDLIDKNKDYNTYSISNYEIIDNKITSTQGRYIIAMRNPKNPKEIVLKTNIFSFY